MQSAVHVNPVRVHAHAQTNLGLLGVLHNQNVFVPCHRSVVRLRTPFGAAGLLFKIIFGCRDVYSIPPRVAAKVRGRGTKHKRETQSYASAVTQPETCPREEAEGAGIASWLRGRPAQGACGEQHNTFA